MASAVPDQRPADDVPGRTRINEHRRPGREIAKEMGASADGSETLPVNQVAQPYCQGLQGTAVGTVKRAYAATTDS